VHEAPRGRGAQDSPRPADQTEAHPRPDVDRQWVAAARICRGDVHGLYERSHSQAERSVSGRRDGENRPRGLARLGGSGDRQVPALSNLREKLLPRASTGEVKEPSSATIWWFAVSLFVQVTCSPA
jgi:hypothetical protein